MTLAWFRATAPRPDAPTDATAALLRQLGTVVHIDVIDEAAAHAFVVTHALRPYDLCVFEPRNTPPSDYIWAYLFQYPGVMLLQDASLHDSRARALERGRRASAYAAEFTFNEGKPPGTAPARPFRRGPWPMLRTPLLASRVVVVNDEEHRRALEDRYPGGRVRVVPPCAGGPDEVAPPPERAPHEPLRVLVLGDGNRRSVRDAVARARDGGLPVVLSDQHMPADSGDCDVVIALGDPAHVDPLSAPLTGMAAARAVIVLEREATAIWPALDPQTWRPRTPGPAGDPVVISIDPRDEQHSLWLTFTRLLQDRQRVAAIGTAARQWWLAHATPAHAAAAWMSILQESLRMPPPGRPAGWPAHLDDDGRGQERRLAHTFRLPTLPMDIPAPS